MTTLATFDAPEAIALGRQLRRSCANAASTSLVAAMVADTLAAFEPAWASVRVFVTRDAEPELVAARGDEWTPALARHIVETSDAVARIDGDVLTAATPLWSGSTVLLLARATTALDPKLASAFETLALYVKLTWLEAADARAALGERHAIARADALDELLTRQENVAAEAQRGADAVLAENVRNLRRTQRAMLNVIEDLREARAALATKVDERTRELALTNQQLETRNRDLEDFVYIASHDLQEPLRTVAGYLQMIERRYADKLGPDGDEFIRFAIDGAQRMQALIESLLLYSRVATKPATFEAFPLDEALDAALRNLSLRIAETGATVERTALPTVRADRIQMIQLFQNLVSNGLKFAGDEPPRVHVSGEVASGACTLVVRDEGIGFNPKYVDRIFKMFRRLRRDTPGTGIGLAVCKKIVERLGGQIDARSAPGEGATFTVQFPAGDR